MNFTSMKLFIGIILAILVISDANGHNKGSGHSKVKTTNFKEKTKLSSKSTKLAPASLSDLTRNFIRREDNNQIKVDKSMKRGHQNSKSKQLYKNGINNNEDRKETPEQVYSGSKVNIEGKIDSKLLSAQTLVKTKELSKNLFNHKSSNNIFHNKHIEAKPLAAVYDSGYVYEEVYSGVDCTGDVSFISGSQLGSCMTGYNGNSSQYFDVTCSSTNAIVNVYSDTSCDSSTFQYAVTYTLGECTNNATSLSPLGVSYSILCTSSTTDLPITGTYVAYDASYNESDYTCSGSPVSFSAFLQDYCFSDSEYYSFKYGCNNSECSGEVTLNRGIALEKCLTVYDIYGESEGSIIFYCDIDEVIYYLYEETGCQGSYELYYFYTDTCLNEDSPYGQSYSSSCSSSLTPPVDFESILVQGYEGGESYFCDTEVTQYAAYSYNYCFKFENDLTSSYLLNCTAEYDFDYITEYDYYNSNTCSYASFPVVYDSGSCYYVESAIPYDYNIFSTGSEIKSSIVSQIDSKQLKTKNSTKRRHKSNDKMPTRPLSSEEIQFSKSFKSVSNSIVNNNLRQPMLLSSTPTGYAQTIIFDSYGDFGYCGYKETVSGIAVGVCLVYYYNSVASDGEIYEYTYADSSCSGTYTTSTVTINDCIGYDDDLAFRFQCTTGTAIPTEEYSVINLYYEETDETCAVYPVSYTYYPGYQCINDYATNTSYEILCEYYGYNANTYTEIYEPYAYNYSSLDCEYFVSEGFVNKTCGVLENTGNSLESYYTSKCAIPGEYYGGDDEFTTYSYTLDDNFINDDNNVTDDTTNDDYFLVNNATAYLYYYFNVECYSPNTAEPTTQPTTFQPFTLQPIIYPTLKPIISPTLGPISYTQGPTVTPYSNVFVAQVITGVGYTNYTKNTTAYILSIEQSIVYSVSYITTENIYSLEVIPPSTVVTNVKSDSTTSNVPSNPYTSLSVVYGISSTSIYVTDESIINQLNSSVSSGDFTYYLNQAAIQYSAPGLDQATASSITTYSVQFPTAEPASSPSSNNGLSPGLIALTVILVVFGVAGISFATYYFLFLSKQEITPSTTTATVPEISTKQVDIQLQETHPTTENPMAAKSNVFGAPNKDKPNETSIGVVSEEAVKVEPSAPPATTEE
eukprot:gene18677-24424_t